MVGVSGGKDSVALTIGLARLRRYLGFDYEVVAVTLDPQFDHQAVDYSPLAALFARHGVPYEVRRTEIGPIVFEYRQEKEPLFPLRQAPPGRAALCRAGVWLQQSRPGPSPRRCRRDLLHEPLAGGAASAASPRSPGWTAGA